MALFGYLQNGFENEYFLRAPTLPRLQNWDNELFQVFSLFFLNL